MCARLRLLKLAAVDSAACAVVCAHTRDARADDMPCNCDLTHPSHPVYHAPTTRPTAQVRESLVADASVVRLWEKSPAFYETGLRLARISGDEDAARLPAAIQATLATRVANILSRSQHSLSADVSEYKNGLTNLEQALFEGGFEYVRDRLAWKKRQSTTIRAGDARVGGVEGSLEIGAASRGTKRPRRSAVG